MFLWWTAGSALSFLLALRALVSFRALLSIALRLWRTADDALHQHQTYTIPKYNDSLQENPLYRKAITFIDSLPSLEDSTDALLFSSPTPKRPTSATCSDLYLQLADGQTVHDTFLGSRLSWTNRSAGDALVLRVRKDDRRRVLRPYLQHIEAVADEIDGRRRDVRLFINTVERRRRRWKAVPFTHPSTMETLAMDPDLKARVRADLESFLKNKNYYHRLGRVWKRSYLLHGPPGTGKSSFIAAMAKFLGYDIYDLDLGRVSLDEGSDLKSLLLQTSPRSVIVVEDLDRYLTANTAAPSSLSGVLGFMDGIFSCCGEERLMVFTMREMVGKEGIDPAVLRPGRLDVHLYFPLCDFTAFKTMASSYLGLKDHKLYPAVEEIFQSGAALSPAEIGEIMIANRGSPSRALKTVISALQQSTAGAGAAAKRIGLVLGSIGGQRRARNESGSWSDGAIGVGDGGRDHGEDEVPSTTGMLGSNGALNKEIKKLYGLIRRGGSRREGGGGGAPLPPPPQHFSHHHQQSSLDLPPPPPPPPPPRSSSGKALSPS